MAIFNQPQPIGYERQQVHVVRHQNNRARVGGQRLDEGLAAFDIKVVGRLIEDQQVRRIKRGQQQRQTGLLAPR